MDTIGRREFIAGTVIATAAATMARAASKQRSSSLFNGRPLLKLFHAIED